MRVDYIEQNNGTSSDHEFKEDMNDILNIIDYIFTEIEFKKQCSLVPLLTLFLKIRLKAFLERN